MTIAFTTPFSSSVLQGPDLARPRRRARRLGVSERFRDRKDAGRQLAPLLEPLAGENPVVLGLPRGGVPVAFEVACALHAPLDVLVVRKVGLPWQPELGLGAVGGAEVLVLNTDVIEPTGVSRGQLDGIVERVRATVAERA